MDPYPNTKNEHVLLGFYSKVFVVFSFREPCGAQQGAGDFHRPFSSLLSESLLSEGWEAELLLQTPESRGAGERWRHLALWCWVDRLCPSWWGMNVKSGRRIVDSYPECQDTQSGHQASLSVTSAERTDPKISTAWLLSGDTLMFPSLCCSCWVERLQGSSLHFSC